jgi:hypothetical protein
LAGRSRVDRPWQSNPGVRLKRAANRCPPAESRSCRTAHPRFRWKPKPGRVAIRHSWSLPHLRLEFSPRSDTRRSPDRTRSNSIQPPLAVENSHLGSFRSLEPRRPRLSPWSSGRAIHRDCPMADSTGRDWSRQDLPRYPSSKSTRTRDRRLWMSARQRHLEPARGLAEVPALLVRRWIPRGL